MKHRIHLIAGARPNFMKVAPILRELEHYRESCDCRLVHTGQHYDANLSDVFFDELGIRAPDYHLEVGSGSHARQTASVMLEYEKICLQDPPDLVIVVGDVNSTLACAIVAKKLGHELAHVEAGLRSGDLSMPEEINRIVTDSISDQLFVTEQSGVENLQREGRPETSIHFVGHVMIDNLFYQLGKLEQEGSSARISDEFKRNHENYGVVTLHRPSNVDDRETLAALLGALADIGERLPLIFPLHPRTGANLERFELSLPPSIVVTEPLPYMDFLNLFRDARLVLTDSGGLQEETTALGIPCLTLRENTERPVTVSAGSNRIVGNSPARILDAARASLDATATKASIPPLWDGRAAERICRQLLGERDR